VVRPTVRERWKVLRVGHVSVATRRLTASIDQLERFSWTGTRPKRVSYVYKYQLVTQVE
jgi:hypothetical protein